VPEPLKKQSSNTLSSDDLLCQEGKPQAVVDHTIDTEVFREWAEVDNPWTYDNETDDGRPNTIFVPFWLFTLFCLSCVISFWFFIQIRGVFL